MDVNESFQKWIKDVKDFDLTKKEDVLKIYHYVRDLNKITQQAEKGISW